MTFLIFPQALPAPERPGEAPLFALGERSTRPSLVSPSSTSRSSPQSWRDALSLHQGLYRTREVPAVAATSPSTGPDALSAPPGGRGLHSSIHSFRKAESASG